MLSSNKGDLISAIKFEDAPRIDSILIYPTKIVIQHNKTSNAVAAQVKMLRAKREKIDIIEDVGSLHDKRIRSLSPNHVIIRIPNNKDFVRISQTIDIALRTMRSLVDHGVSEDGIPMTIKLASTLHTEKCIKLISSLGAIIIT
jgi:hypothetical protein